jgi:hypothetical protein
MVGDPVEAVADIPIDPFESLREGDCQRGLNDTCFARRRRRKDPGRWFRRVGGSGDVERK